MPTLVWWTVLGWNVVVLLAFAWDKLQARGERRRVPEGRLLVMTWLCGCVGAWLAMELLRHKTRKGRFRRRAIALSVLNPLWLLVWAQLR